MWARPVNTDNTTTPWRCIGGHRCSITCRLRGWWVYLWRGKQLESSEPKVKGRYWQLGKIKQFFSECVSVCMYECVCVCMCDYTGYIDLPKVLWKVHSSPFSSTVSTFLCFLKFIQGHKTKASNVLRAAVTLVPVSHACVSVRLCNTLCTWYAACVQEETTHRNTSKMQYNTQQHGSGERGGNSLISN